MIPCSTKTKFRLHFNKPTEFESSPARTTHARQTAPVHSFNAQRLAPSLPQSSCSLHVARGNVRRKVAPRSSTSAMVASHVWNSGAKAIRCKSTWDFFSCRNVLSEIKTEHVYKNACPGCPSMPWRQANGMQNNGANAAHTLRLHQMQRQKLE